MKKLLRACAVAALCSLSFLTLPALHAQVPQIINYQGRVAVGTTNFNGSGAFKFALVNAAGTTTYWSNDGTSTAGSQPTAAVSLTVAKGLYSVLLGDTTLANMTAIPNSVFANADVRLRVWFNDGATGSQLLTPDQRLAAVGYAMVAGSVPDGSITSAKIATGAVTNTQLATNAVQAANIAAGAVGSTQLAPGAAATNLGADPPTTVIPVLGMAWIRAGRFIMGSPVADPSSFSDERPQTWVTISSSFYMGVHEVTQREYLAVIGSNPSLFTGDTNRPVENVTWANANTYCSTLTTSERTAGRIPAGWGYRLPTEAEWEYCCRAAPRTTIFSYGDDWATTAIGNYAWFPGNAGAATHPVEQKQPNAWGLMDMHGNVWEWVKDFYNATQYPGGSVTDPQGPVSGTNHVARGGSYATLALLSRCAERTQYASPGNFLGFRVVLSSGVP